jgi:hypothetical protein
MKIDTIFLLAVLIVGLVIIHRLDRITESLKRHELFALDDIIRHVCPTLSYAPNPRTRAQVKGWFDDLQRLLWLRHDAANEPEIERLGRFVWWHDRYVELYDRHKSQMPSEHVTVEVAAAQGNHWAQVQLVGDFSSRFECEGRKRYGLTRVEAQFLLYVLWSEDSIDQLPLKAEEWNTDNLSEYLLSRRLAIYLEP